MGLDEAAGTGAMCLDTVFYRHIRILPVVRQNNLLGFFGGVLRITLLLESNIWEVVALGE